MEKVFKSEFKAGNIHKLIFEFFCSYLLSIILLSILIVLVYLGTLAQTEMGIYEVQKMFFDSIFFMYPITESISVPLPGGYLILSILVVNIICGGIIRLKYGKRTLGILIIHIGVIYLLLAGLVSFHFAQHGFVRLNEGESADYFESWTDWDLQITEFSEEEKVSYRVPINNSVSGREFNDESLPFTIKFLRYAKNATITQSSSSHSVDGFSIKMEPVEQDAARNVPAVKIEIDNKRAIVWGRSLLPFVIEKDSKEYQFKVIRKREKLPFELTLQKFTMELHPNTDQASFYESNVKVNGTSEVLIQMNEPLRLYGVAVFQSSYEKHQTANNILYTSVFSTVVNPSDQWPLYACIILSIGLLLHFIPMLIKYVKKGEADK